MRLNDVRHTDWRRLSFVPLTVCSLIFAAGCGSKPSVVGSWSGQEPLPSDDGKTAGTVASRLDLRADGSFHKKGATQAEYNGTYTVKDNTLTETFTSYSVEGRVMAIPADTPNVETDTFTLKGDTLTLTPKDGGAPSVLTRQATK
jgi:hypothetical protein